MVDALYLNNKHTLQLHTPTACTSRIKKNTNTWKTDLKYLKQVCDFHK
jgi:hypothetical protein